MGKTTGRLSLRSTVWIHKAPTQVQTTILSRKSTLISMRQRVASISHVLFLQIWILDLLMSYSVIEGVWSFSLLKLVLRGLRALDTAFQRAGIIKDRIYAMNT